MLIAGEMRAISNQNASKDDYVRQRIDIADMLIKNAALKGDRYVCFYDICHSCDKGWTRDKQNMVIDKLKENGFKIVEKWRIFGGNQITPYVVW